MARRQQFVPQKGHLVGQHEQEERVMVNNGDVSLSASAADADADADASSSALDSRGGDNMLHPTTIETPTSPIGNADQRGRTIQSRFPSSVVEDRNNNNNNNNNNYHNHNIGTDPASPGETKIIRSILPSSLARSSTGNNVQTPHLLRPRRLYSRSADQERLVSMYRHSIQATRSNKGGGGRAKDDNSTVITNTPNGSLDGEDNDHNEDTTTDLLILSGGSGVGKTTLALSLEPHVVADQGFFVRTKCSQDEKDPLAPYKSILDDLMRQLFATSPNRHDETAPRTSSTTATTEKKWKHVLCFQIRKAAGEEIDLLEQVVPSMKQIRKLLHRLDEEIAAATSTTHPRSHRRLRSLSRLSWKDYSASNHPQHIILTRRPSDGGGGSGGEAAFRQHTSTFHDTGDDPVEPAAIGTNTLSVRRFEYAFQKVCRAIASPKHPFVILIDDVQNTKTSHNRLEEQLAELASTCSGGLFFLMTYRIDHDVAANISISSPQKEAAAPDNKLLQRLQRKIPHIQQHHWPLSGFSEEAIHELLIDTLSFEQHQLHHLSQILFESTQGNVLFVLEILRAFQDDDLLRFDEVQKEWMCDDHLIRQHPILRVKTLQDLHLTKILDLPPDAQEVLKVSACLGVNFRWSAAKLVIAATQKRMVFSTAWGLCEEAHLVELVGKPQEDDADIDEAEQYAAFTHDSIHQAAYQLIPVNERGAWHLKIGQTLWNTVKTGEELDLYLFVILEQLFFGESLIQKLNDRIAVASLCLHAGETAAKTGGFELSATYLQRGIDLLGPTKWTKPDTYELCLALFNNAIDTCYATGQMDRVQSLIQEVLENARVFEDEIRARVMLIYTLGTKQDMATAIDRGVETLKLLGERMVQEPSKLSVRMALAKTRRLLRRNSDTRLMRLPAMTDQRLVSVQMVLNVMWLSAYYNNAVLAAMISCRMVELSVKHGASVVSCVGFAMFATMVLGGGTHLEESRRYAMIAFDLAKRFGGETWLCRISTQLYGMVNIWVTPMPYCLERLKHAYQVGLGGGDMEYAMLNASLYIWNNVDRLPIHEIEARARSLTERMTFLGQEKGAYMLRPVWQMSLNFLGQAHGDPTLLTGEVLKDDDIETLLREAGKGRTMHSNASLSKMMLAYHFSDFEAAVTYTQQARLVYETFGTLGAALARLYDCLALLEMMKQQQSSSSSSLWIGMCGRRQHRKEMRVVKHHLKMFRYWANQCPANNMGKLCLVEAEVAWVLGNPLEAQAKYHCAILLAKDGGIRMEQALVNERAGKFHLELGNRAKATEYLREAYRLYKEWGGIAKIDHLSDEIGHLVDLQG